MQTNDKMNPDSKTHSSRGPLLDHLNVIEEKCLKGDLSLREICDVFGPDGHYILILFLIIPFLQPVPLLGLSTPFGLLIATVCVLAQMKKPPHLPKRWAVKKLPAKTVSRIAGGCERVFEKLAFILHPRLELFFKPPFSLLNTLVVVLNAVLLALPLPIPFSNVVPGWAILFHTLGQLEEDGAFILLSYVQTALCLGFFIALGKGATAGFEMLGLQ